MAYQFTRIAVKIGSNVLARKDGTPDVTRMSALVDQIAELHKAGVEVILISSGAVASGRSEIKPSKKLDSVDQRQLFSARAAGSALPARSAFRPLWNRVRPILSAGFPDQALKIRP